MACSRVNFSFLLFRELIEQEMDVLLWGDRQNASVVAVPKKKNSTKVQNCVIKNVISFLHCIKH